MYVFVRLTDAESHRTRRTPSNTALVVAPARGVRRTMTDTAKSSIAVLESIARRDAARKEHERARKDERLHSSEDPSTALVAFNDACAEIERDIQRVLSDDEASRKSNVREETRRESGLAALGAVNARATALDATTGEFGRRASAYDVRVMRQRMCDVRAALVRARGVIAPREPFRFKSRASGTRRARKDGTSKDEAATVEDTDANDDSPGTRDRKNEVVVVREVPEGEDYVLERLADCDVFVLGAVRALRAHDLKRCRVFIVAVAGSAHLENVADCVFCLATRQLRAHAVRRTRFHVRAASRPIIEDSREVAFAPLMRGFATQANFDVIRRDAGLPVEENGMWREVDDFLWLKASASPHWSALDDDNDETRNVDEATLREAFERLDL